MADDYKRPDPDILLKSINRPFYKDEMRNGKLKIFFGMAAGVGKTYAMLEAAQHLKREGIDVVIGYIETHGRAETEVLSRGLEIVPRRKIEYRNIFIDELDIDAVLARKPAIALVDELAHSNAEGSRHAKRYQDIIELLDNGISVFTAVNIQHIESQAVIVEKITEARVREIVPDSMLNRADEIELVDIPAEELLKRLGEGKVYIPEKAGLAAERFFKKSNLTALREMSLSYTARLVGHVLRDYTEKKNIRGVWKSGERLMVGVSPSPYSEYLLRWTKRMAFNLNVPWIALYVDSQRPLSREDEEMLTKNLNLATELGAEVISTADENIVKGLIRVAGEKNITQIVVGKPLRRYFFEMFSGGDLVTRLLKRSGEIEIHVVTEPRPGKKVKPRLKRFSNQSTGIERPGEYVNALAAITVVTIVSKFLVNYTGYWTIGLIYLLTVVVLSLFVGRKSVLLAAALSAMTWNYLFIPPLYEFRIDRAEDVLMVVMYFITAIIAGGLTSKLRLKERALRIREERISALYDFSRVLGTAFGIDEVMGIAIVYIEDYFESLAAIILPDDKGELQKAPHPASSLDIDEDEHGVALWSFKNKKPAGLYTDTLPNKKAHYQPLMASGKAMGVLGIRAKGDGALTFEKKTFLQNLTYQLATRLEKENLSRESQKVLLYAESERLYKILLNSVSHELRTPITAITAATSSLLDPAVSTRADIRNELVAEIKKAGERLNRLVDNLLDMSRLESGLLKLNWELHDVNDLISVAVRRLENELESHAVTINMPDVLPMVRIDFALMEQVVSNIVYNAVMHTPPGTMITIAAAGAGSVIKITVSDNGPGIDPLDMPHLFEKFHRGRISGTGGTGLGLSICKGIVEAHGGVITVQNNSGGGASFIIEIPLDDEGDVPLSGPVEEA